MRRCIRTLTYVDNPIPPPLKYCTSTTYNTSKEDLRAASVFQKPPEIFIDESIRKQRTFFQLATNSFYLTTILLTLDP